MARFYAIIFPVRIVSHISPPPFPCGITPAAAAAVVSAGLALPPDIPRTRLPVAILFAMRRSHYFHLDGVDSVWDELRDARNYSGPFPVVAHPPCRLWGKLAHLAWGDRAERDLALFALECVRRFGGVLEHPCGSALWPEYFLPRGNQVDLHGGRTIELDQGDWGHPCRKRTRLYVVAPRGLDFPVPAPDLRPAAFRRLDLLTPRQRERTPPAFASALVDFAALCGDVGFAGYRLRRFPARHVRAYKNTKLAHKGERQFGGLRMSSPGLARAKSSDF